MYKHISFRWSRLFLASTVLLMAALILAKSQPVYAACSGDWPSGQFSGICPHADSGPADGTAIVLVWLSSDSYDFYQVRWAISGQPEQQIQINSGGKDGWWVFSNTEANIPYIFKVQGCNSSTFGGSSCSDWSEITHVRQDFIFGPDTCMSGFVWREANAVDHVCVTPDVRNQTAQDNQLAASRRDPNGGPYGPDTCLVGFVWRDAFVGDHVCVTPQTRSQAAFDNQQAPSRYVRNN